MRYCPYVLFISLSAKKRTKETALFKLWLSDVVASKRAQNKQILCYPFLPCTTSAQLEQRGLA